MKRYGIDWPDLSKILEEGERGEACVEFYEVSKEDEQFTRMRAAVTGSGRCMVASGQYVRLKIGGYLVMSNTDQEKRENTEAVDRAEGDVLVAGLGLGLMLIPVCLMDRVRSVTAVEISQDVIDLVGPPIRRHLEAQGNGAAGKLEIVQGDIFEFKPRRGQRWDIIWFDVWADSCVDNIKGINRLKQKFKGRLNRSNPVCWMGAWEEDRLRYLKRAGRWR